MGWPYMSANESLDQLVQTIYTLNRDHCIDRLRGMKRPQLDFTDKYLHGLSLDRLRHVLVAASIQSRRRPPRR